MENNNLSEWFKKQNISKNNLNPIVIFEGCDGTGKSTIINMLTDIIKNSFVLHTSAHKVLNSTTYYTEILNKIIELLKILKQPIILDRFHIGELTYGSIYRPNTINKNVEEKMYSMENDLLKLNTKIIYVNAFKDVIKERLSNRGDWYVNNSDVDNILNKYEEVLSKSKLEILRIDTSNNLQADDIKNILEFIFKS